MTNFYNFALKIETNWAKRSLSLFWKLEMPPMIIIIIMILCIFSLFIL